MHKMVCTIGPLSARDSQQGFLFIYLNDNRKYEQSTKIILEDSVTLAVQISCLFRYGSGFK